MCMHDECGAVDTACTMHAASLIPHARSIDERCGSGSFWIEYLSKRVCTRIFLPVHYKKKYINLKGLPNNKCSCMRCHWHRVHDFCVRKSIMSKQKMKKNWMSKISWHCPFNKMSEVIDEPVAKILYTSQTDAVQKYHGMHCSETCKAPSTIYSTVKYS
jgi:hypothetical protein